MTYANVETIVHGKWILAGEHAVIRGFGALIFPIPSQQLRLQFNPPATIYRPYITCHASIITTDSGLWHGFN